MRGRFLFLVLVQVLVARNITGCVLGIRSRYLTNLGRATSDSAADACAELRGRSVGTRANTTLDLLHCCRCW